MKIYLVDLVRKRCFKNLLGNNFKLSESLQNLKEYKEHFYKLYPYSPVVNIVSYSLMISEYSLTCACALCACVCIYTLIIFI